jgi:purine-binding chemotaxis protein CheW
MTKKEKLNASLEGLFSKPVAVVEVIEAEPDLPPAPTAPKSAPPAIAPPVKPGIPTPAPELAKLVPREIKPALAPKAVNAPVAVVNERQLVVFSLAGEFYGVDINLVESIIRMEPITVVPHAPRFLEGVINMRGEILPVVDLCRHFDLPSAESTKETRIIVVEVNTYRVGMVVDAVTEVLRVSEDVIEPPAPLITTIDSTFINGIAKVPDRLVILLDLVKILATKEKAEVAA